MKYFDYQLFLINGGYVSSLSDQLDYEYMPSWWFGVRDDCYIGVYCSRPTTVDYSKRSDCNAQVRYYYYYSYLFIIIIIYCFILLLSLLVPF